MIIKDANVPPMLEHGGTCRSWFFFGKEELRKETMGGYLEFIDEFELRGGAALEPHSHETDEFYYILRGEAMMRVGDEEQPLKPGQLVHIPRNEIHSIRALSEDGFRALAFAVSYMPEDRVGYTAYPVDGSAPHFVTVGEDKLESESVD
jgi:mannose-6-phosphate isomerase-like protein (cupin superfamily)